MKESKAVNRPVCTIADTPMDANEFIVFVQKKQELAQKNPLKKIKLFSGLYIFYDGKQLWEISKNNEEWGWDAYVQSGGTGDYLDRCRTLREAIEALSYES